MANTGGVTSLRWGVALAQRASLAGHKASETMATCIVCHRAGTEMKRKKERVTSLSRWRKMEGASRSLLC